MSVWLRWSGAALLGMMALLGMPRPGWLSSGSPDEAAALSLDLARIRSVVESSRGGKIERRDEQHAVFELVHPRKMHREDSRVVALQVNGFAVRSEVDPATGEVFSRVRSTAGGTLDEFGSLALSGVGFEIEPKEPIKKPPGTRLPTKYAWTIRPLYDGSQRLTLDLAGFIAPLDRNEKLEWTLTRPGQPELAEGSRAQILDASRLLEIDIQVGGWWGEGVLFRSLAAVLGWILIHPLVVDWIKRSLRAAPGSKRGLGPKKGRARRKGLLPGPSRRQSGRRSRL